jgi:hypothetical protein
MRYVLLLALALAGCTSFSVLDREMPKLVGQPIDVAVQKLGFPNNEQTIMGQKVYTWNTSQSSFSVVPTTSVTTAYVGTVPVQATTTSFTTEDSSLSCVLRLIVDDKGIIRRYTYTGNNGACFTYSNRLG